MRRASVSRKTTETDITVTLDVDGTGKGTIATGIGFFDHMLSHLSRHGLLDLDDLRGKVSSPAYAGRRKIGAFSAASNVSGVTTPVHEVARILHQNGALAFFDFAASAPYVPMDMRRDEQSFFDALYFSPHKFLGGPGSCGVLIFHQRIYRADLPPTANILPGPFLKL